MNIQINHITRRLELKNPKSGDTERFFAWGYEHGFSTGFNYDTPYIQIPKTTVNPLQVILQKCLGDLNNGV